MIAVSIAAPGCSRTTGEPVADRPPAVTASPQELALAQSSNGDFAIDLYRQLAAERPGENLFFSPFSISSALLMAAEGASGETAEQMGKVLRVPHSLRSTGAEAAALPWQLAGLHKGQAAIYYRLSPEPISPELRDKIARLRDDLAAANSRTAALNNSRNWEEATQSNAAAQKLADELNPLLKETEPYEWRAANGLWAEKTCPFRASFLDTMHTFYGGVAFPVDFRSDADAARQQINAWVARQTLDRVKDFMGPGAVNSLTRLVITNAVYFKGEWLDPFDALSTRPADFHLADGKRVSTPMMSKYLYSAGYGAFNGDGTAFDTPRKIPVDMPDNDPSLYPDALTYKGGKLFMVMIVPQSAAGLGELERRLPSTGLKPWIDRIADRTVIVNVPKFKLETDYALEKPLRALGMVRAFNRPGSPDGAQFDRMTAGDDPAQQLFISAVLHKTFVEVNEKGTEAAAVTGLSMEAKEAEPPRPKTRPFIPTFRADKPFLFAMCDAETHSILFLGRLVSPQGGE
jgi:serine protease inhibitor